MLQQHRARIDSCHDILVQKLNIIELWPKLFEHKIFNPDDVNISRWQNTLRESATKHEILMTIKTRGPHAFDNFLKSLREIGQSELAVILQGSTVDTATNNNANNVHNISLNVPQNIHHRIPPNNALNNTVENLDEVNNLLEELTLHDTNTPVVINVRKSTEFLDEGNQIISRYPMRSRPRGLVLVITLMKYVKSMKPRRAAEHDHNNLVELFEQMGFLVEHRKDLSATEIRREVFDFSQRPELRKVDSCFVIISGHGDKSPDGKTVISGIDDTGNHNPDHEIACLEIIEYFSVERCPNLATKPKVFIFQMCRGQSRQYAVMGRGGGNAICNDELHITNADMPHENVTCNGLRNYDDILIAQSTLPGYVSFRDEESGTWFIQALCKVFMNMAWKLRIRELFDLINIVISTKRTNAKACQTPTVKNIGFKHLYINPGLFPEGS